jgi:hypothetical protein
MKAMRYASWAVLVGVGLLTVIALAFGTSFSQGKDRDDTRARMRGIFLSLSKTYLYSLDPAAFEDPANRVEILTGLRALAEGTATFKAHTGALDPSYDYMRRSLAHDARDALARFEMGQFTGTRWVLAKITENCMTCHSKFRAEGSFDLGHEFLEKAPVKELSPSALAELQIAVRQFDDALSTYETIFRDPKSSWATLSLVGAFEKYLRVCIVVRDNEDRAVATLKTYAQRDDLSPGTKAVVENWIASLKKIDGTQQPGSEFSTARKIISEAQRALRYPSDRTQLVDFIASTSLLHRYIQAGGHEDVQMAEAYYLLAIAESHISTSYWISETDFLLEQAIRAAPKSQIAGDAYDFLVTYIASAHSMARNMPENVSHNLDELRMLVGPQQ